MRRLIPGLLVLSLSGFAWAQSVRLALISAADTGLTNAALSGAGATTLAIKMDGGGESYNTLSLTIRPGAVGTTTTVRVSCKQSRLAAGPWTPIMKCSGDALAPCAVDQRDFPWTSDGVTTVWKFAQSFAQCTAVDPSSGTGTATVTGEKSRQ